MTIKKLTVAAAIAVGIATCSFSSAMAACPISNNSCCGLTPAPACCDSIQTQPTCGMTPGSTCDCNCNPSIPGTPLTGTTPAPACGCGCNSAPSCGCATPCNPCSSCAPACGSCPSTCCDELDMKQVYAYPNAIYGTNNYVGVKSNAIYSTQSAWQLDCSDSLAACRNGFTGAAAPLYGCNCAPSCGCLNSGVPVIRPCACCDCGCASGCASPMPMLMGTALPCSSCGCSTGAACGCNSCEPCGCSTSIQTSCSMQAIEKSFAPVCSSCNSSCDKCSTGAAAPLVSVFPDVPDGYWAGCAIDKLACANVIAGYPDRTFKPSLPVSRAEFASMMVKGLNMNLDCCLAPKKMFKDVSCGHWANPVIAKAVEEGIMCGYPNNTFKPKAPVTRTEALTALGQGIKCDMDSCKAQEILSQYTDACKVPEWAQIPVAKALQSGALKETLKPCLIDPCNDASRAEIASMLQTVRVATGLDNTAMASKPEEACPCTSNCDCNKTTYMETDKIISIPTLKVKFLDEINAKSSHVGQQFAAITTEDVTINGCCYPCGSRVNGKIVEVIRPSGCDKGALKVAFTEIVGCDGCKVDLPRQVISAQVSCDKQQNAVARLVAMPFTLFGSLVGTTGRTIGGMIANAGNAVESVSNGVGIASSELLQTGSNSCGCTCSNGSFFDRFTSAGRSLQDAAKEAIIAPVDLARTALSGTVGLFQTTGDEVAYLVDPSGTKISAINPKECVTIAFGCH